MIKNHIARSKRKVVTKFQHLVLFVKDLAETKAFYEDVFRLQFSARNHPDSSAAMRLSNQEMNFFSFGYYHHDLAFAKKKDVDPDQNEMLYYSMKLRDDEKISDLTAKLKAKKVPFRSGRLLASAKTPLGLTAISFQDPNKHWIEVIGK